MQYRHDGEWRQLARVTGPTHNCLGLLLTMNKGRAAPRIEALGPEDEAERIKSEEVLAQVARGIAQANTELGTAFAAEAVRFVRSDSPGERIYEYLAQAIVREAAREADLQDRRLAAG